MSGIQFTEAIEFLRLRLNLSEEVWQALLQEVDEAARARASNMSRSMFEDVLKAIIKSMEEGTTIETFRKDFDQIAKRRGWQGDNEGGYRSSLIFRNLTSQATAAGRWRQIQKTKKIFPFLRYITVGDHRVRPEHAKWDGLVLSVDDPWWLTHYPPNGHQCRCFIQQLNQRMMDRWGYELGEAPPINMVEKIIRVDGEYERVNVPAGIDPGFAFNAGERGLLLPETK